MLIQHDRQIAGGDFPFIKVAARHAVHSDVRAQFFMLVSEGLGTLW